MTNQESHFNVQAVRRVYENELPTSCSTITPAPPETIYLVCHPDDASGKDILLWEDILAAFKEDVIHVRYGAVVLPYLKGSNFKNLEPLRIAKIPGAIFDIVVKGQLREGVLSVEPPKKGLFTWQEDSNARLVSASLITPATIGRNPTDSHMNEATGNFAHNHNQTSVYIKDEREWQLQVVPYPVGDINTSNSSKHGKHSNTNSENSDSRNNNISSARVLQVQVHSSLSIEDLVETMEKASQGDQKELPTRLDNSNARPVSESMTNPTTVRRSPQTIVLDITAETLTYSHNHIWNSAYLLDERESQSVPYHIRAFNNSNASNTVNHTLSLLDRSGRLTFYPSSNSHIPPPLSVSLPIMNMMFGRQRSASTAGTSANPNALGGDFFSGVRRFTGHSSTKTDIEELRNRTVALIGPHSRHHGHSQRGHYLQDSTAGQVERLRGGSALLGYQTRPWTNHCQMISFKAPAFKPDARAKDQPPRDQSL